MYKLKTKSRLIKMLNYDLSAAENEIFKGEVKINVGYLMV